MLAATDPHRFRVAVRVIGVLLLSLSASAAARAEGTATSGSPSAESSLLRVELWVYGSADAVARARLIGEELVQRLPVRIDVHEARAPEAGARMSESRADVKFEVDLRSLSRVSVVMFDGAGSRELSRRVLPEASSLEVSTEATSYVISTQLQTYLRTRAPRESRPPVAKPPARAPEARKRQTPDTVSSNAPAFFQAEIEAQGRLGWLHADQASVGFALGALARARRPGLSPQLQLLLAGYLPERISRGELVANWWLGSLRLLPGFEWRFGPSLSFVLGLGGGVDWFRLTPVDDPDRAVRGNAVRRVTPVLTGVLGLGLSFVGAGRWLIGVNSDLELAPTRYVAEAGPERRTFLIHNGLRPQVFSGVSFPLGAAPESPRARSAGPSARGATND
ncbi:MAG TPA: hypothetical protein VFQ61_24025 [Polyangiaceae bacterium]|nr:hypothetical protein [Polyangiaceae bacterium]